jgi:RNA polymerase sigma-70 factor (ECF subfamily)
MNEQNFNEAKMVEPLIDMYSTPLVRYCYGILGNYCDAEDAAQSVFIKLCLSPDILLDVESVKAYLYKTAYHACIDITRKNKRSLPVADAEKLREDSHIENRDSDFPLDHY